MKIKTIEVKNYKAFYGKHQIKVNSKNLFIYGENGSGKSSLYYALKDFFQSSIEDIKLNEAENVFIKETQIGKSHIKVIFNPNSSGRRTNQAFEVSVNSKDTNSENDTSIRDSNKLKSFLTYKHLLNIHNVKKGEKIDLFPLLIGGVLKHFKYPLTHGKELGELWEAILIKISKNTNQRYNIRRKRVEVDKAVQIFNDAIGELFNETSDEYILKHAEPILEQFNQNLEIKLFYRKARPNSDYSAIQNNFIRLELNYAGKQIDEPHLFLNEARLSSLAISIYLGMIKRHIQGIPYKVLFLDDIFIGLDISNRLPLLKILNTEFPEYQLFITTYDKPWYEYAKSYLEGAGNWLTMEFYAEKTMEGYEIPKIFDKQELLAKAQWHFDNLDYKASAVYTRSALEKILRTFCQKTKKEIVFKARLKDYTTEDFWKVVKLEIEPETKIEVEQYRDLVLNTFSHYNTERHEFKSELENAINTVKNLEEELKDITSRQST